MKQHAQTHKSHEIARSLQGNMKQHTLTHKSHEIAAAAAAAVARGEVDPTANDGANNGSSSSDGRPDSARSREDSNSSPLLEAGLKRSPAALEDSPPGSEPLPKRLHGKGKPWILKMDITQKCRVCQQKCPHKCS